MIHKAVWTGDRGLKIGVGSGICPRCRRSVEDIFHLFINCSHNQFYFNFLQKSLSVLHPQGFDWKELLLGEANNLDSLLWNKIIGVLFFHIWKDRSEWIYAGGRTNHKYMFVINMRYCVWQVIQKMEEAVDQGMELTTLMKEIPWKHWDRKLNKFCSVQRHYMAFGILSK